MILLDNIDDNINIVIFPIKKAVQKHLASQILDAKFHLSQGQPLPPGTQIRSILRSYIRGHQISHLGWGIQLNTNVWVKF